MPGLSRIVEIEVTSEMGKSFQVTTIFPSKSEIMQEFIHNNGHIELRVFIYRSSEDLHDLREDIKRITHVIDVKVSNLSVMTCLGGSA